MAIKSYEEDSNVSTPIKRIRWATQRITGPNARRKRGSLLNRFHKKTGSMEKKRESDGSHVDGIHDAADSSEDGDDIEDGRRRIFFNIPLPDDAKNDEGHPLANFGRNKIRTAKYTPLSFIPKNLWFQFHNIANIYFLFVIILGVRNPGSTREQAKLLTEWNRSSKFSATQFPLLAQYR